MRVHVDGRYALADDDTCLRFVTFASVGSGMSYEDYEWMMCAEKLFQMVVWGLQLMTTQGQSTRTTGNPLTARIRPLGCSWDRQALMTSVSLSFFSEPNYR